ncbi:MAG: hypothetical protein PGN37_16635 [Mycobacterium kyogaense]|uniref:hypothetical protein n=1 Tax=Mycobacterium kyogaense TaxID=2212479 RepID=UPI002FFC56C3
MFEEHQQAWLKMVDERTGGSERHLAAAEAILANTSVPAPHVDAAEELVRFNLVFPQKPDGSYEANLFPKF